MRKMPQNYSDNDPSEFFPLYFVHIPTLYEINSINDNYLLIIDNLFVCESVWLHGATTRATTVGRFSQARKRKKVAEVSAE